MPNLLITPTEPDRDATSHEPLFRQWPLALRTWHSALAGACSADAWAQVFGTSDSPHFPERLVLADRDNLASLPEVIRSWGRERVIPGVSLCCVFDEAAADADDEILFIAQGPRGYAAICHCLSWRNEQPTSWRNWLCGGDGPYLADVAVLIRKQSLIPLFEHSQASVYWHCLYEHDMEQQPDGIPMVALAVLDHRDGKDREHIPLRKAVAQREGQRWFEAGRLDQLPQPSTKMAKLLAVGREFLASCASLPPMCWHLPPSPYADAVAELRRRAEAGLQRRYAMVNTALRDRFERELKVIVAKGFAGYLLTVDDLAQGRRTCGRGSGASSLIVYCLGITNVDPQRYNLLFERFLNNARVDPPDLDVDFPWDERDAVLTDTFKRFGHAHVAMVANHCYLRRGSALRVLARSYGQRDQDTSRVQRALRSQRRFGLRHNFPEPWPGIIAGAHLLEGRPHHQGLHCGGVVITPEPIRDLVPIHLAAKHIPTAEGGGGSQAIPVIDWEKDGAEDMGLVKIDLLGNRSLAVVRDCLADLRAIGIDINEDRWHPADDPITQRLVASGQTMGCFYIESPAMRQLQAKAQSGDFDRLVVHSSIIRPAANHWINTYLERLHDFRLHHIQRDEWYPHPCLRDLLSESFGILSYQEDVMQCAVEMAGFNERQANALRKALGHWGINSQITYFSKAFRDGALAQGCDERVISQVWEMISSFAGYSFCKAHSASYAMVSFQCAWLKAHFPAYFMARVIAHEGGFYHHAAYFEEARRHGIQPLAPCVMRSEWLTKAEGPQRIRCGLHRLPALSRASADRLLSERQRKPFRSLTDLRRRVQLSAGDLDMMARAGALDRLYPQCHRGQILWLARQVGLQPLPKTADENQLHLLPDTLAEDPEIPRLPRPNIASCAEAQLAVLGFCPPFHPLHLHEAPFMAQSCAEVLQMGNGRKVSICVQVITRKQVQAKTTDGLQPMSFVTVEDESGILETIWFNDCYRSYGPLLDQGSALLLTGVVQVEHRFVTLNVQKAELMYGST